MVVRVRVWPQEAGEAEEPDKRHHQIVWLSAAQGFQQQAGWIDLGVDAGGGGVMKAEQFYALAGLIYLSPRTNDRFAVSVAFLFFVLSIAIGWRREKGHVSAEVRDGKRA